MELQEFITTTLLQITNGIIEAQNQLKDSDCFVNPDGELLSSNKERIIIGDTEFRSIQNVKMNIVVSITETTDKKSEIGVVNILKAGIGSGEVITNDKVSSIEFEIPVSFPVMRK
jgi:hypothetical protein